MIIFLLFQEIMTNILINTSLYINKLFFNFIESEILSPQNNTIGLFI